jgi:hypothetical protein
MAVYNDGNRAFLQAFMGRSSMTFEDARPVLAAILSVSGTRLGVFTSKKTVTNY